MHLSLERLISTVALLSLAVAIVPQLSVAQTAFTEQSSDLMEELLGNLLKVWALDIIVISISVDHVSLSLSIIPFLCIFPTALLIGLAEYETFMRILGLAILTIVFVFARYLANSI
jgi:hypothetical protein